MLRLQPLQRLLRLLPARPPVIARPGRVLLVRSMRKDGKAVAKADLPSKVCATCQRPFTWRKAWERCWEEVRFCSDRCRSTAKRQQRTGAPAGGADPERPGAAAPDAGEPGPPAGPAAPARTKAQPPREGR